MASVLLVEPDRLLAETVRQALERRGHTVRLAPTAQRAISLADDARPDLVILELQLVAHSGIEFLYEFRSYTDWLAVPVIIYTNVPPREFNDSRDILMRELGVTTYLYKPSATLRQLLRATEETVSVQ